MKKLIEVTEVEGEGLGSLVGEQVLLFGINYIYAGKLVGVNTDFVKLEDPKIVYETGVFRSPEYKDAQLLHTKEWYVRVSSLESYGRGKQ